MSAISAAAMRCKTMSDGSLRIEVEVEPNDAQAAFAMFGRPGAPMALAALVEGHAAVNGQAPASLPASAPEALKGGDRARWVAMRCQEQAFQDWLCSEFPTQWAQSPEKSFAGHAAWVVRSVCGCASRSVLDSDPVAADKFERLLRKPWAAFNGFSGVTA